MEKSNIAQNLKEGLELNMTSTGRTVGTASIKGSSLYKLVYTDSRPGSFPEKYSGRYTSVKVAEHAKVEFIKDTWEVAEAHNKSKKNKVA